MTDVDGCLTDGTFGWGRGEKLWKRFGPDDNDALKTLNIYIPVLLVSADRAGWHISESRAQHMGLPIVQAPAMGRDRYIEDHIEELDRVVYVGDSMYDVPVLQAAGFSFAPADAASPARGAANRVLRNPGGHRAVAEAVEFTLRHLLRSPRPRSVPQPPMPMPPVGEARAGEVVPLRSVT